MDPQVAVVREGMCQGVVPWLRRFGVASGEFAIGQLREGYWSGGRALTGNSYSAQVYGAQRLTRARTRYDHLRPVHDDSGSCE